VCLPKAYKAQYEIATGSLLAGRMPNKANKLIQEWIELHREQLNDVWNLVKEGKQVFPLLPLE